YGVALGGAFFGESMFRTKPEMDKFALYYCHQRLGERHFVLWDTQFYTPHLGNFGCIEISQGEYLERLQEALKVKATFFP
ncbi:MAG: leucyl/phenylalanyl-tRNA--protein transferase, partial [Leptospiraceae bacterium]|nr:leucyl/phenylalanyl-tRNA--protein transferase [Leptospiraceae bacterium]